MSFFDDNKPAEKPKKMKYRTVLIIDSEHDPALWSLENFYWAVQNWEAVIVKETTRKIKKVRK